MELISRLKNANTIKERNNNIFLNKKNKNSFSEIKNKLKLNTQMEEFNDLIPEKQINLLISKKIINKNIIKEDINKQLLLNKIKKLFVKNSNLTKIISLLKNIIAKLKEDKENHKLNNKSYLNKDLNLNILSLKDLEIEKLKEQIEYINKIFKEKIKKYTQKIHMFLFENYQLKQEIYQKNEEFIQIEKRLEITEKRIKETLFEIKNNKINKQNDDKNPNQIINDFKEYSKKENLIIEKINIHFEKKEDDIEKENKKNNSIEKNWINKSIKDIESTIFTSSDSFNQNYNFLTK